MILLKNASRCPRCNKKWDRDNRTCHNCLCRLFWHTDNFRQITADSIISFWAYLPVWGWVYNSHLADWKPNAVNEALLTK